MIDFRITYRGTAPLLMHNSRLANPLDPATKALKKITGKRKKTDEDHELIARLEHAGSLYWDSVAGPYIPSDNIWRALYDGAKKHNLGVKVKEGVLFPGTDINPLVYRAGRRDVAGADSIDGLWADENLRHFASVKVGTSRTMRCRPVFRNWEVEAAGVLDPRVLDFENLGTVADTAGMIIGLGDWRPKFGRFTATVEKL